MTDKDTTPIADMMSLMLACIREVNPPDQVSAAPAAETPSQVKKNPQLYHGSSAKSENEIKPVFYHGSRTKIEDAALKPGTEKIRDPIVGSAVFASSLKEFAALYMMPADDPAWINSGLVDGQPYVLTSDRKRYEGYDRPA